ncbi:MAG: hypothetical protein WC758_02175 [Candidatus Woesearchaeota archaeon]|jgi:hypothetical protein
MKSRIRQRKQKRSEKTNGVKKNEQTRKNRTNRKISRNKTRDATTFNFKPCNRSFSG